MSKLNIDQIFNGLGKQYSVETIDFEKVIYRDFGNGFNVEISGIGKRANNRPVNIYLWYGEGSSALIVKQVKGVERSIEKIAGIVEILKCHSRHFIKLGYNTRDKIWHFVNEPLSENKKKKMPPSGIPETFLSDDEVLYFVQNMDLSNQN